MHNSIDCQLSNHSTHILSSQHDILFPRQKLQLPYKIFNHLIPQKLFCRATTVGPNALLFFRMAAQMEQVPHDFVRVIGLGNDGIFEGDGVIFAGTAGHGDPLGGHRFKRATASMAILQRLSGSKRPILKRNIRRGSPWRAISRSRLTAASSTGSRWRVGMPLGMTSGLTP